MLIHDILPLAARRRPDATALRFGAQAHSYAELDQRVHQAAAALAALADPGERVAILARNCPAYLECCYAAPAAGLILTFVNFRLAPAEIGHVLRDSGASLVLAEPEHLPTLARLRPDLPNLRAIVPISDDSAHGDGPTYAELVAAADPAERPAATPDEDDVAWLMYTSGTTGRPKGAMLTHRSVTTAVLASAIGFQHRPDEVCVFHSPMCHITAYYLLLWHLLGFDVTLLRGFDPDQWCRTVARQRVTYTLAVPTVLAMLLEHPGLDEHDLSSLTGVLYGGAPMPAATLRRARNRWPQVGFHTAFGMTELAGNISYLGPDEHRAAADGDADEPRLIGRPLPLGALRVVDAAMRDAPTGVVGELLARGEQLAVGYWRDEPATAAAFADGWFHTGDLARKDADGRFHLVGRVKDMIITGGENVYPAEVEDVLSHHPRVLAAAVVGVPDPVWGERVAAAVRPRPGASLSAAELTEFCRTRLARYKTPRQIVFVDELPTTASGKVAKPALRKLLAQAAEATLT